MSTVDARRPSSTGSAAHETAGASTRTAPVWDPATGGSRREVLLAERRRRRRRGRRPPRTAFETLERRVASRAARAMMFAFRNLVEQHTDELARIVASEHGKVVEDAKGEVIRGMEVVEFACGIAAAAQGRVLRPGLDRRRLVLVPPAARRLRRHHAVQLPGDGPDVDAPDGDRDRQHVRAQAVRARPVGVELHRRAVRRGRAARRRLQRRPRRQGRGRRAARPPGRRRRLASSARPRSRSTSTSTASATGKRVQALGGAKNHAVVLPDADLDFAANHLTAAGFGSAGQRCMAIAVAVAVGDAAEPLVERLKREGARRSRSAPGSSPTRRWARSSPPQARDRIVGYIDSGERRRRRRSSTAASSRSTGDGFFVGPTLFDRVTTGDGHLHATRSSARCSASCASTRSTRRSS